MEFDWDEEKASQNIRKHDITFEETETVFGDPLSRTIPDDEHSQDELRFITLGMSELGRLILVVHTADEPPRIISARFPTRGERKDYEEKPEEEY